MGRGGGWSCGDPLHLPRRIFSQHLSPRKVLVSEGEKGIRVSKEESAATETNSPATLRLTLTLTDPRCDQRRADLSFDRFFLFLPLFSPFLFFSRPAYRDRGDESANGIKIPSTFSRFYPPTDRPTDRPWKFHARRGGGRRAIRDGERSFIEAPLNRGEERQVETRYI